MECPAVDNLFGAGLGCPNRWGKWRYVVEGLLVAEDARAEFIDHPVVGELIQCVFDGRKISFQIFNDIGDTRRAGVVEEMDDTNFQLWFLEDARGHKKAGLQHFQSGRATC